MRGSSISFLTRASVATPYAARFDPTEFNGLQPMLRRGFWNGYQLAHLATYAGAVELSLDFPFSLLGLLRQQFESRGARLAQNKGLPGSRSGDCV
jgi:hypothetical protein